MQQKNFRKGVRINEEQDGNVNNVCTNALTIEEIQPILATGRYSFQKKNVPY
jgi:hypothetical protein